MDQIHAQLLEKIKAYKMPQAAVDLLTKYPPLLVAGPTAAGKETIISHIEQRGLGYKVITSTTRVPRPGEENGKDYWFVSEPRMIELLDAQAMIEVKSIHNIQVSGISLAAYQTVVDKNTRPILVIDVHGIEEIMTNVPNLKPIFILPPSFEDWMERLDKRGAMSHVERERRLDSAAQEMQIAIKNDRFILVVNNHADEAAEDVLEPVNDKSKQFQNRALAQRLIDHINRY